MNAFDDPRNPYRFYTNDFGTLIDSKGEFDNNDVDDYWYDKKGNKITGYEYQNLKESKKKRAKRRKKLQQQFFFSRYVLLYSLWFLSILLFLLSNTTKRVNML